MPPDTVRNVPAKAKVATATPRALRPINVTALHSDAAALRELTRRYLRALEGQHAKEGLLAVAAHELRHPLHLMRMSLARHLPEADSPAREGLERYINRMSRLIDDLIDFIRLERDALELQREWIEIDRLLTELADEYGSSFEGRHVRLSLRTTAPGAWINADAQRLIQVFSNLFDNALKFTPAGGSVTIDVHTAGGTVEVRIRDTGRGIPADLLARALELPIDLSSPQGPGIGLCVARRIIELHGGTIALRSDGPGRGAEVVVGLPAVDSFGPVGAE